MSQRPLSLDSRIQQFYDSNPDEELTIQGLMLKFGITRRCAYNAVYRLAADGLLEHAHVVRLRVNGIAKKEVSHG